MTEPDVDGPGRWIRGLLGADAGVGAVAIDDPSRDGHRRAGLAAATIALHAVGAEPATVVGHEVDGRPIWPTGWTGSISHGADLALGIVVPHTPGRGVGIDVERGRSLPREDAAVVLTSAELARTADGGGPTDPTVVWSAKEAAFKAWSHASNGLASPVDPREIRVRVVDTGAPGFVDLVIEATGALAATLGSSGGAWGRTEVGDRLVTLVVCGDRPPD